jgi:hypothetical protein
MPGYYVALRLWPGFPFPFDHFDFPFDRFDGLDDSDLPQALDAFASARIPLVVELMRREEITRRRAWNWFLAVGGYLNSPHWSAKRVWCRPARICRVGAYLGWWRQPKYIGDLSIANGRRELSATSRCIVFDWIGPAPTYEHARQLALAVIQYLPHRLSQEEQFFLNRNPRFSVVDVEQGEKSFDAFRASSVIAFDHDEFYRPDTIPKRRSAGEATGSSDGLVSPTRAIRRFFQSYTWPNLQLLPKWNREMLELSYGGEVVKRFGPSQIARANYPLILDAFEREGWPVRIDNPLLAKKNLDHGRQLNLLLYELNSDLRLIVFSADGSGGGGITWQLRRSSDCKT